MRKFKKLLIDKNKTVADIAGDHNISRQYFSAVLNGKIENYRVEYIIREYTRAETR